MTDHQQQRRISFLRKMILELAKGNFQYRIELSGIKDTIEDFSLLMNMLAEELGLLLTDRSMKLSQPPIILIYDQYFTLVSYSIPPADREKFNIHILLENTLDEILLKSTLDKLKQSILELSEDIHHTELLQLGFTTNSGLSHWSLQGMLYLLHHKKKDYYLIQGLLQSTTPITLNEKDSISNYPKNNVLQLQADIQKIRDVHQYILNHLHESLPSIIQLSRQFNLNENKLKKGFKQLYQTTIFKFHLHKRLEQSLVLIKNTPMSLKTIASSLAFKSFPHFSRAFKLKYGISPNKFRNGRN